VDAYGFAVSLAVNGATGATLQPCNGGWGGQGEEGCSEMSVDGIVENARRYDIERNPENSVGTR